MKKTLIFICGLLMFLPIAFTAAASEGKVQPFPENITDARWLWSKPEKNTPMTAYMRYNVTVSEPVKSARFHLSIDRRVKAYINGKALRLGPPPELKYCRGPVLRYGADITKLLKPGKNVIAFECSRDKTGHFGLILRGKIEFESGKEIQLFSSAANVKASGKGEKGWNTVEFNDNTADWQPAWERGNVWTKNWSIYADIARMYCTPEEYKAYRDLMSQGFPHKKLAAEPEKPTVKIVYKNQIPGVMVNGKIYPPHYVSSDAFMNPGMDAILHKYQKMDMPFYSFPIDDNKAIARQSGHYDFNDLDLSIRRLLAINPDAKILLSYRGNPIDSWMRRNPDELVGYAIKRDRYYWEYCGNPKAASFASKKYREEVVDRFVKELADFANKQPWGRRVVGLMIQPGGSADGMPWGCHDMPDTGKRMTEAFRRFLTQKYPSDQALQKSWNDPTVTRATATVPDMKQRLASGHYLRDPGDPRDRRVIDYYECYHKEYAEFIIDFGKSVKRHFPGRLAGAFFGYVVLSYTPEGSSANFEPILQSPYIDFLNGVTQGQNLTDGLHRLLHSVFHRYGKLTSIEADIRTHNAKGQTNEAWRCKTPEESRATITKVIGNSFFYGCGYHTVDFGQWFKLHDCPEMLEVQEQGIKLWAKIFNDPPEKKSDVAVILDPEQIWRQGSPIYNQTLVLGRALNEDVLHTLNYSGYSHDWMALEDFLNSKHDYKVVIFMNQFSITAQQREALLKKLRRPNVTAIWNYAPGILGENGFSEEAMKKLTGLDLKIVREKRRFTAALANGQSLRIFTASHKWMESPRVYSVDPEAEVLASYLDDNTGALIRKKLSDGSTAIFAGIPISSPKLWAELLKDAGCHAFTKPGVFVRRNNKLLQVFCSRNGVPDLGTGILIGQTDQSGRITVKLEKPALKVIDLFTGKVIAENTDTFLLTSENPHTWLLEVEEAGRNK